MDNIIEVTESSQNHINKILLSEKSDYFRITVLCVGCAGFQYKFDFSNKPNDDDLVFNYKNVDVLIDKTSIVFPDFVIIIINNFFKFFNLFNLFI